MLRVRMRAFALTAVGRDRPGIVAAITRVLLDHSVNVEDSQMTILRGHFTMMLVVAAPDDVEVQALADELRAAGEELDLELLTIIGVDDIDPADDPEATHVVSVYGVDHPGIVHAVSATLAERGATITDLTTRIIGDEEKPLYALIMEVELGDDPDGARAALEAVGAEQGVDVSVRPLEADAL
jgi:glycine cleavage system transcriptional repressor